METSNINSSNSFRVDLAIDNGNQVDGVEATWDDDCKGLIFEIRVVPTEQCIDAVADFGNIVALKE